MNILLEVNLKLLGVLLLVLGGLLVGLRVFERVSGGFIGEVSIGGTILEPSGMPLLPIGLLGVAVGAAILWRHAKRTRE